MRRNTEKLKRRKKYVITKLNEGKTIKWIANKLYLTERTIYLIIKNQ